MTTVQSGIYELFTEYGCAVTPVDDQQLRVTHPCNPGHHIRARSCDGWETVDCDYFVGDQYRTSTTLELADPESFDLLHVFMFITILLEDGAPAGRPVARSTDPPRR